MTHPTGEPTVQISLGGKRFDPRAEQDAVDVRRIVDSPDQTGDRRVAHGDVELENRTKLNAGRYLPLVRAVADDRAIGIDDIERGVVLKQAAGPDA